MTDGEIRLMTYDQLAGTLGIARESARQLTIRKRWNRLKGNDGRARVQVPEEALRPATSGVTADATGQGTGADTSAETAAVLALTRHIERLEEVLATAEKRAAERDALAAENRVLEAVLAAMRDERNRWHAAATARRRWWQWLAG